MISGIATWTFDLDNESQNHIYLTSWHPNFSLVTLEMLCWKCGGICTPKERNDAIFVQLSKNVANTVSDGLL